MGVFSLSEINAIEGNKELKNTCSNFLLLVFAIK